MFLAHLPAAFLLGAVIKQHWPTALTRAGWAALLLGSIAPDADWLYFLSTRQALDHHHECAPHLPMVWLGASVVVALALALALRRAPRRYQALAAMASLGWLSHLLLDGLVGELWWFAPWVDTSTLGFLAYPRFEMLQYGLLHRPSIWLECAIIAVAAYQGCRMLGAGPLLQRLAQAWKLRPQPRSQPSSRVQHLRALHNLSQRFPLRPYREFL
jgi:hypothetical protein